MKTKVSGCQWDIDLLKEFPAKEGNGEERNGKRDDLAIIPIEDGVYIQMGTVTGKW